MLFKLSNLNWNLALTVGYLNPALNNSAQRPVPREMVNFNPGLSQTLSKVFLSENMQLELTKYCSTFTPKYSNDDTKCYSKQCSEK